jgi:hypothetical protein
LTLEGVNNVHGGDSLTLSVLSVGDGITNHVLEEDFQNAACFFVDEARDSLHTTTPGESPNGRLSDSLNVITENFAMTFRATLAKTLSSFASSRHVVKVPSASIIKSQITNLLRDSQLLYKTQVLFSFSVRESLSRDLCLPIFAKNKMNLLILNHFKTAKHAMIFFKVIKLKFIDHFY